MDYPIGFVRWTEQRNFQAILQLLESGQINVDPLITHRFSFNDALTGYKAVDEPGAMGIMLEFDDRPIEELTANQKSAAVDEIPAALELVDADRKIPAAGKAEVAFIGAGNFASQMLLPLFPKNNVQLKTIVSSTGVSAAHAGKKFGFGDVCTDSQQVWDDANVNTVVVSTPHSSHASLVSAGLKAGKHVFVEKPLALTHEQLDGVVHQMNASPNQMVMIGFNRRFSPHTQQIKQWLQGTPGPKSIIITMNAGAIPANHWTQDPEVGGGRINGEACHLIDLARYLVDSPIVKSSANTMVGGDGRLGDCVSISLSFADGSIATVHYFANGSKDFPKERFEVFAGGKVAVCNNFLKSNLIGTKKKFKTRGQDKGHKAELQSFVDAVTNGGDWPISAEELIEVTRVTLDVAAQVSEDLKS